MAKYFLVLSLFLSGTAFANRYSAINFDDEEVSTAIQKAKVISQVASSCLDRTYKQHTEFFAKNKYSKFFGDRHWRHKTPDHRKLVLLRIIYPWLITKPFTFEGETYKAYKARIEKTVKDPVQQKKLLEPTLSNYKELLKIQRPDFLPRIASVEAALTEKEKELKPISCVGLSLQCLSEGFDKAGLRNTWKKIYAQLTRKDQPEDAVLSGVELQKALMDLGWKSYFWNIDPRQNAAYDVEDRVLNPLDPINKPEKKWDHTWGNHEYRYAMAMKPTRQYYGIYLHDRSTLVGFGKNVPRQFANAPFFLGTAHAGYHVFPGHSGRVTEAHSKRDLDSIENLEDSPFDPDNQESGGGPRYTKIEKYRSGVIVVPPGYVPVNPK